MKNQRKSLGRRDALAELVLDDRDALAVLFREDVVQEGRFPAPEEAGQDRDGDLRHREPARGAFVHRARNGSARRSRVAPRCPFSHLGESRDTLVRPKSSQNRLSSSTLGDLRCLQASWRPTQRLFFIGIVAGERVGKLECSLPVLDETG